MVTVCGGRVREVGYCLWGESERSGYCLWGESERSGYCLWGESERSGLLFGWGQREESLTVV